MSDLGETLKLRREALGYGQEQVADKLGVRQQTVSRWEQGHAVPRPARVLQLAELLEVDAGWLHRVAGYLPAGGQHAARDGAGDARPAAAGPWHELHQHLPHLSRTELVQLLDRVRDELRARERLRPPGTA